MSNENNSGPGRVLLPKDRIVERGRGCYNCKAFDNGAMAKEKYASHRAAKVAELRMLQAQGIQSGTAPIGDADLSSLEIQQKLDQLKGTGLNEAQAIEVLAAAAAGVSGRDGDPRFRLFDGLISSGAAGVCLVGGMGTDFVHGQCLCDKWNGRQGSSMATSGKPLDKLPDEIVDIADSKAKKV
jgi:hypothetical protein